MGNIAIAWELGENWGHLARDLPLALHLKEAGHRVSCVVADTRTAAQLLRGTGISYLQAPVVRRPTRPPRPLVNHAEIVMEAGYDDPSVLRGLVGAWRGLLDIIDADALLIDYAPTAVLASRILGIPSVLAGTGFELPPDVAPLPTFRTWETVLETRLLRAEEIVLRHVNQILGESSTAPLRRVSELFQGTRRLLTTFPELDHFGERAQEDYVGPVFSLPGAKQVAWRDETAPKVFAYLRPWMPRIEDLLGALGGSGAEVICAFPGAAAALVQRFSSQRLRIFTQPVALAPLLPQASLVIAYGSGTVAAALLAGVPVLLIPRWAEQYLGARPVETIGAGLVVRSKGPPASYPAVIDTLLSDPDCRLAAGRFAAKYAGFVTEQPVNRIVCALEEAMLSNRSREIAHGQRASRPP